MYIKMARIQSFNNSISILKNDWNILSLYINFTSNLVLEYHGDFVNEGIWAVVKPNNNFPSQVAFNYLKSKPTIVFMISGNYFSIYVIVHL